MAPAKVFEETYQRYLQEIRTIDILSRADLLGVEKQGQGLLIPLYDALYHCSPDGITGPDGTAQLPAVRVILLKYILTCPQEVPVCPHSYKTYREFPGAGPLTSYFTANTNKILETTFSGRLENLRQAAARMGGVEQKSESYDYSVRFYALPRIPVLLNFNDRDDSFPAVCSVLYLASAECFLDMECLAMTGTLMAGKLIRPPLP